MRLDGRRQSSNIQDRRGVSGKAIGVGGGIIGVIIAAVITFMSGGNVGDVAQSVFSAMQQQGGQMEQPVQLDAEDQRLYDLSSKVLAGTEDVWTKIFREQGWGEYKAPQMIIYKGSIQTGCGQGTSQTGPFYCSADQTVYIDLDFFKSMQSQIGASGDFCYAYVIAHEVGHHVQYLLGTLDKAHSAMSRLPEKEANKISVCLELQADYFAGVWGHQDNKMFGSIEPGDVENAINAASKIGDDYIQKQAYGYEIPDAFNHGRSEWRVHWLSKGLKTGDASVSAADTFSGSYPPK